MTAEEFKINFYKDLEIVPFDNERDTNLMVKNHIFKGIYQCLVNQEKIMKMLNKKQFIKNIVITLIIGLSLISCAEDTPQELRAKAKQMEEKAKAAVEEANKNVEPFSVWNTIEESDLYENESEVPILNK